MDSKYFLLFKTAQAEFRAWSALSAHTRRNILPIVELTRGRKIPKSGKGIPEEAWKTTEGIYDFSRNVDRVRDAFKESDSIVLDLTREDELSCYEIDILSESTNGYENWINFLKEERGHFNNIIPTLLINPSQSESKNEYRENLVTQINEMMELFSGVAYRASVLLDPEFLYDLVLVKDVINNHIDHGKTFLVELDHEFIRPGTGIVHALTALGSINRILEIIPHTSIVILSTSFPKSIEELGGPEEGSFPLEEVFLFDEIIKGNPNPDLIYYGDYGSINPLRNDQVVLRGGWRPRIDFPTSRNRIFYYREKRKKIKPKIFSTYSSHYISIAHKITKSPLFEDIPDSWGVKQINAAARGFPPGKNPSFWISVRMEIHILQQMRRLGLR